MTAFDLPRPPEWMADGSCVQTGVGAADLWFPEKGEASREAKALCAGCHVLDACREYALTRPGLTGVWGATSERQRIRMRAAA